MGVEQAKANGEGGKTGSTTLESAAKQAEVVKLRLAGLSLDEIAARVGLAGRPVSHGSRCPEQAIPPRDRARSPGGREKHLVASDHFESDLLRGFSVDDLFDVAVRHRLHFDQARQSGVMFHMLSAITELGRIGLTAVGDSREQAESIFRHAERVILEEAQTSRRAGVARRVAQHHGLKWRDGAPGWGPGVPWGAASGACPGVARHGMTVAKRACPAGERRHRAARQSGIPASPANAGAGAAVSWRFRFVVNRVARQRGSTGRATCWRQAPRTIPTGGRP